MFETYISTNDLWLTSGLVGFVVGAAFGRMLTGNAAGGIISILGAWCVVWWSENMKMGKNIWHDIAAGEIVGGFAGGTFGGIISGVIMIPISRKIGIGSGIVIGIIVGAVLGRHVITNTTRYQNKLATSVFGGLFAGSAVWLMNWFVWQMNHGQKHLNLTIENIGGMVMLGIIVGSTLGAGIPVLHALLLHATQLFVSILTPKIFWTLTPLISLLRFRTVICEHCFQQSKPANSHYKNGKRYCEYCRGEVPPNHIYQKLIVTFGTADLSMKKNVLQLSDLNVKPIEHSIHVSEVYIAANTCDSRQVEQFITYLLNYPPKPGLHSIRIFYNGALDALGNNLRNVLQNTFDHIEEYH